MGGFRRCTFRQALYNLDYRYLLDTVVADKELFPLERVRESPPLERRGVRKLRPLDSVRE